ncbi:MAG: MotA/TolQ/ExbB proton channel family protein [Nitrospinota bacterium]
MIDFLWRGGWIMIPILLCSVLALGVIIERLYNLRSKRVIRDDVMQEVESMLREKRISEASMLCRRYSSAMSRILLAAILNHDKERAEIKELIEDAGRQEIPSLERYLNLLGTIAGITPLLGLLGTVAGMIRVFDVISATGVGHPNTLAGGISEALITTAAGLTVAIPSLVFHSYFASKADGLVLEILKR